MSLDPHALAISPEGKIYLHGQDQNSNPSLINAWFARPYPYGLLKLGLGDLNNLDPSFEFWQNFSRKLLAQICRLGISTKDVPLIPAPGSEELEKCIQTAPLMLGLEYLNKELLINLWADLNLCLIREIQNFEGSVQDYFSSHSQRWNLLGRVCFHLAENKNNPEKPFAFLATYTNDVSKNAQAQHVPLKKALQEYAGENKKSELLSLLLPVQKAAEKSDFIKNLVSSGLIFQTLAWTVKEAHNFLISLPLLEDSGVMIRVPNWWNSKRPPRPRVEVNVGKKPAAILGLDTLLDFDVRVSLGDGVVLTQEELKFLMGSQDSLVQVKGQWVEIDKEKLADVLDHWAEVKSSAGEGISLSEAMKLLSGTSSQKNAHGSLLSEEWARDWSEVMAGDWLKECLGNLRDPAQIENNWVSKTLKKHLQADLRPYQMQGVHWLWFLYQLNLGGCLADDMGLGKTLQVLAFLLLIKKNQAENKTHPSLLVLPASLIGNWEAEIAKFAPEISYRIIHGTLGESDALLESSKDKISEVDLAISTYGFVNRQPWLKEINWNVIVLDEAQAIKNPGAKQTMAVKALKSKTRIALSGTPVENRMSDLWSLFDFTSPRLLGSAAEFSRYEKNIAKKGVFMGAVRNLTQPYILRRLKTDKKIIKDLPDKTEIRSFCVLSKEQVRVYQESVQELAQKIENLEGPERRGLILAYLMRFKQICNHPDQWLGYGDYEEAKSGKFLRLRELCMEIAAKQEKVLVFTQFKEVIPHLANFLKEIFGREGLVLHGETPVSQRQILVKKFQEEDESSNQAHAPPFFILSLKAGGTGLTLTKASHVIHFDRWWNPAVENQATDRAYRIGQKHPVMVHKFISRGSIEEKIDEMIERKKNLSQELLENNQSEVSLTELSNQDLINLVSLDIHRALGEE